MVLYEFAFLEDSTRYHKPSLLNTGLPLDLLTSFANDDTIKYKLPSNKAALRNKNQSPMERPQRPQTPQRAVLPTPAKHTDPLDHVPGNWIHRCGDLAAVPIL